MRSPRGAGKTTWLSWVILWATAKFEAERKDYKIITTAGTYRQLKNYLWPEIAKWHKRARWDMIGFKPELLKMQMSTANGAAISVSATNPDFLEGAHAQNMLYILDECKAIPDEKWDSIEGTFSTGNCYIIAASTPGKKGGRFYDINRQAHGYEDWSFDHVTIEEALACGQIREEWVERQKKRWGEESPLYKMHVLAQFVAFDEHAIFSYDWIEKARYAEIVPGLPHKTAVDVADEGDDDSFMLTRRGDAVTYGDFWNGMDEMETVGRVKTTTAQDEELIVDAIGIGSGVASRLKELGRKVTKYKDSYGAKDDENFLNARAEDFWNLRNKFVRGEISLSSLPEEIYLRLLGDLTAITSSYKNGKLKIDDKALIKKKLKRSPDAADTLKMLFSEKKTTKAIAIYEGGQDA